MTGSKPWSSSPVTLGTPKLHELQPTAAERAWWRTERWPLVRRQLYLLGIPTVLAPIVTILVRDADKFLDGGWLRVVPAMLGFGLVSTWLSWKLSENHHFAIALASRRAREALLRRDWIADEGTGEDAPEDPARGTLPPASPPLDA